MKTREAPQVHAVVEQQLALQAYLDALLHPVAAVSEALGEPVPVHEEPAVDAAAPIVPPWAERPFQCLVFKVAGLPLAVPLAKLNGVLAWPHDITPMPGHSPWFLGLARYQENNVKAIDTALLVLPESRRDRILPTAKDRLRNMILIDDMRWGLGCDLISEVITLEPSDVQWRTARGTRPWLAGTVIGHMCALLDTDAFAHMLATGKE